MFKKSFRVVLIMAGTASLFISTLSLSAAPSSKRENIALGKPYSFSREPNYALCSKDPDRKLLTDGIRARNDKSFWVQQKTVGWAYRAPHITIDLGTDMPISGAAFSTAGGRAGVTFPKHVFIMVSKDGKNFYYAGDLVSHTPGPFPDPDAGEQFFVYHSEKLNTHGRYVRFIPCMGAGPYVFVDELEVYAGAPALLEQPYHGKAFTGDEAPKDIMVNACVGIRFEKDLAAVQNMLESSKISNEKKASIATELKRINQKLLETVTDFTAANFRAVLPYNELHREIFAAFGKILAAEGYSPLTLWGDYRYALLPLLARPKQHADLQLTVRMMQDEYRAEVFNITNAGTKELKVNLSLNGIPNCFEIRQVEYVDTADMKVSSTALTLVPHDKQYTVLIPAGMTRQIWMTFHSAGMPGGTHSGSISVNAEDFKSEIPLTLEIADFALPKSELMVGVWDYAAALLNGITLQNRPAVIEDLRRHLVNVAIGHVRQAAIPASGGIDNEGRLLKPLNFGPFEEWRKLWPDAEKYQIFLVVRPGTQFAGFNPGTPEFDLAIKTWAREWNTYLKAKNIPVSQIQFHFLDEPRSPENYRLLEQWITPFQKAATGIEVFNDPVHLDNPKNMEAAASALQKCDVVVPMLRQYQRYSQNVKTFLDELRKQGKSLWFYSCDGPNRFYDPAYFRFQPWYCFELGMSGSMIWVYSDFPNNWNEYTRISGYSYSMVFLCPDTTTPTKHWEAFREGIQDYGYLKMLGKKLQNASAEQLKRSAAIVGAEANAKSILTALSSQVLNEKFFDASSNKFFWLEDTPCQTADRVRLLILDILKIQ